MNAVSYARLAGTIFAIVALLQLGRAVTDLPLMAGGTSIPVWASWVAFVVTGGLAWLGLTSRA